MRSQKTGAWALSTAVCGLLVAGAMADTTPPGSTRLTTREITQVFSDVRDDAIVKDAAGTSAVNFWCADGTFTNAWSNGTRSGKVVGRWRAFNSERCVVITSGHPEFEGVERCSLILRTGQRYLSVNPDGSIHGVHTLSPITATENRTHCPNR